MILFLEFLINQLILSLQVVAAVAQNLVVWCIKLLLPLSIDFRHLTLGQKRLVLDRLNSLLVFELVVELVQLHYCIQFCYFQAVFKVVSTLFVIGEGHELLVAGELLEYILRSSHFAKLLDKGVVCEMSERAIF